MFRRAKRRWIYISHESAAGDVNLDLIIAAAREGSGKSVADACDCHAKKKKKKQKKEKKRKKGDKGEKQRGAAGAKRAHVKRRCALLESWRISCTRARAIR
jgi:hypothetical protein